MCRPIILLCGFYKSSILQMPSTYIGAILRSGGTPITVPPENKVAEGYIGLANGLLLVGGGDIKASLYGGSGKYDKDVDYDRDIFELNMVNYAVKYNIPILGICRGCQVINIAFGGTLHEDIRLHSDKKHLIHIKKGSILDKNFDSKTYTVNSYHHQACKDLGKGLKRTAFCDDGYTEAFEGSDFYCHGLQFHPEKMPEDFACRNIFNDFINACNQSNLLFL